MPEQQDYNFTIGEFTFETFHEYRDAQEDVKKIECINKELDVQDPKVAVRLYNDIRRGDIVFKSPIGEQFFDHIADIVADKSVGLLGDREVIEEAEGHVKYTRIMGLVVIALATAFFSYFAVTEISDIVQTKRLAKINEKTEQTGDSIKSDTLDYSVLDDANKTVQAEFESYLKANPDTVGYLSIDGTEISYPVVQKDNDNEYYLKHAFDGSEDSNGTLFVDYRSNVTHPTTNTIIYGHNMKSGKMFGTLKAFLNEDYYNQHKTINFNTIYENRTYYIIAVGLSEVGYQDDDTSYKYYDFINDSKTTPIEDFEDYINSLSVYTSNFHVSTDDELLTLSTCNSYTEDGRLFVVAKRIN